MVVSKSQRSTKQRAAIKKIIRGTTCHPTADWIYEEARKILPEISLGTVYRNLQLLISDNYIQELNYGKGFSRFDGNPEPHYHFVCEECGEIIDFHMPKMEEVMDETKKNLNCEIHNHRLEIYGACSKCQNKIQSNSARG